MNITTKIKTISDDFMELKEVVQNHTATKRENARREREALERRLKIQKLANEIEIMEKLIIEKHEEIRNLK